ncbi:MAG: transaldolase family protein [Candidatus Roizmanbacteria bacterium]
MAIKLPKIFLDSGNPEETKQAKALLGFLDGQTTNPSLVVKNPEVQKSIKKGKKLKVNELLSLYKEIITQIDKDIAGPLSVEVYANWDTKASTMLKQAEEMFSWGRNIHVKFPTIPEGLKASAEFVKSTGPANMTLVFNQQQAGAIYSATLETKKPCFVSPFVGRWDDRGMNGIDLVKNIIKMYKKFDKQTHTKNHVLVLSASIRSLEHFYASIVNGADMITVPLKIIQAWVDAECWMPDEKYHYPQGSLKALLYNDLPYHKDYTQYNVVQKEGDLLDEGLNKFANDWDSLIEVNAKPNKSPKTKPE